MYIVHSNTHTIQLYNTIILYYSSFEMRNFQLSWTLKVLQLKLFFLMPHHWNIILQKFSLHITAILLLNHNSSPHHSATTKHCIIHYEEYILLTVSVTIIKTSFTVVCVKQCSSSPSLYIGYPHTSTIINSSVDFHQ